MEPLTVSRLCIDVAAPHLARQQLPQGDAKAEDVCLVVVGPVLYHLPGEVGGGGGTSEAMQWQVLR